MQDQTVEVQATVEKPTVLVVNDEGTIVPKKENKEEVKTFDQKDTYWRKRIGDKTISILGQLAINFKDIGNMMDHTTMDKKQGGEAITKIMNGFQDIVVLLSK